MGELHNGRMTADDDDDDDDGNFSIGGVRGGKMIPQRLFMGRNGGAPDGGDNEDEREEKTETEEHGRGKNNGRIVPLHRGLVITDELRKELLNPLAQRFKLLRGAH